MPSARTIATVAGVTLGAMFVLNMLAAKNATARRLIRGTPVAAVSTGGSVAV